MSLTITAIEPTLPEHGLAALEDLACEVISAAARLDGKMKGPLRDEVAGITRWMHSYYSNLIEGQQTKVRDIEAALKSEFSSEPKRRSTQQLALAHLTVQAWARDYAGSPFDSVYLCELHRRFYELLPAELRIATTAAGPESPLDPGALRDSEVEVGNHLAPPPDLVPGLLRHFRSRYEAPELSRTKQIVAVAASHHRLAWIHPFRDGNGRVVRLFSDTLIRRLGIDGGGLWSLSRGLMIHRAEYYARLANADHERQSRSADDGRGHLSERTLREFCEFILRTILDQISFMDQSLDLDTIGRRIEHSLHRASDYGSEGERIFFLLREALNRGEFERGEAGRITGMGERSARTLLARAVKDGLLKSETPKGPVRLALPAKVLDSYFPRLFPPGEFTAAEGT